MTVDDVDAALGLRNVEVSLQIFKNICGFVIELLSIFLFVLI